MLPCSLFALIRSPDDMENPEAPVASEAGGSQIAEPVHLQLTIGESRMADPDSPAIGSSPAEAISPDLGPLLTVGDEAPRGLQIKESQPHRLPQSSPLYRTAGVAVAGTLPLDLGDGHFATVVNVWARHLSTGRDGNIYNRAISKMQFYTGVNTQIPVVIMQEYINDDRFAFITV